MWRTLSISCLAIALALVTQTAVAQTVPVLKAKGDAAQCESFNAWLAKAEELGGEGVTGWEIESQHFVARIPPAFADSVFVPMIGKPYRDLSNKEKKKILTILKRCMGQAGRYTFLSWPFDTSRPATNSTMRDLLAAIENVPESDVDQAQQSADARTAKEDAYAANRPERIAKSFPGDPSAVRRNGLRNARCFPATDPHYVAYNDYVYDGQSVVEFTTDPSGRSQPCDANHVKDHFVDGLRMLQTDPRRRIDVFAIGDLCASEPAVLYLSKALRVELPEYGTRAPNPSPTQRSAYFDDLPYKFYVASGSDGIVHPGIINPAEYGMLVTRNVISGQCGRLPNRVNVYAGTTEKEPNIFGSYRRSPVMSKNLEYWQYYSGSFNPNRLEDRLVHDDAKLAETYATFAQAQRDYIAGAPERKARQEEALAMGAFIAIIGILAIQATVDPCLNPNVSQEVKRLAECDKVKGLDY